MTTKHDKKVLSIAKQNDLFRSTMMATPRHRVVLTSGVHNDAKENVITAVRNFNEFTKDNDPYGEHDFGQIEIEGTKYFWKIDYYDLSWEYGVEDAKIEDHAKLLTIMLASEY